VLSEQLGDPRSPAPQANNAKLDLSGDDHGSGRRNGLLFRLTRQRPQQGQGCSRPYGLCEERTSGEGVQRIHTDDGLVLLFHNFINYIALLRYCVISQLQH
jgi:hypothetical protein